MRKEKNIQMFNSFIIVNNKPIRAEMYVKKLWKKNIFDQATLLRLRRLREIYKKITETTCAKCGKCCARLVVNKVYSVEYLNILKYIKDNLPADERDDLVALIKSKAYLAQKYLNIKKPRGWRRRLCIFRDKKTKLCRIYESRPLTCRFWGLVKRKTGQRNTCSKVKIIDKKNKKLLDVSEVDSLRKEVEALSEYFIYISKYGKDILVTRNQSLNNWILAGF